MHWHSFMESLYVILYKNNMQTSWYTFVLETSQPPGTLWARGFQEFETPKFRDSRHVNVSLPL